MVMVFWKSKYIVIDVTRRESTRTFGGDGGPGQWRVRVNYGPESGRLVVKGY